MIELHNVTKVYQMGLVQVRALDGVSVRVEPGEFVAITGASGSGKSTMMHIIGALDRPTAGTYRFQSQPVDHLTDRQLATLRNRRVGFVFQTFNLINASSALNNVALPLFYAGRARTAEPAMKALEAVGLANRATHRPTEMSGGERQRVAIARAIVNNPAVVLADEPTGNLDSKTGQQIMDIFHQLNHQGVTIILVTHEPDIAAQAKRVILMRDGKIEGDRSTDSREGPAVPPSAADRPAPQTPAPDSTPAAPLPSSPSEVGQGRWIDVDLTHQLLTAYEGSAPVRNVAVSTGLAGTPTPVGQFRIWVKFRYDDMEGPGYYLPNVPYTMYFHEGYGLHGTYWHNNFGHPMSHGCVNLPTSEAEWVFNWAEVGTLVNVHN